jgi:hypothetical protein
LVLATEMDDHFEQMLAPSTAAALNQSKYIPVNAFEGRKLGFVFKKGAKGLGYYSDHTQKLPVKVHIVEHIVPARRSH